jgi:hypothetical protein
MSPKKRWFSLKALLAVILYLIIPLGSLLLIIESYPELSKDQLVARIYWVIPTALAVIILAQVSTLFKKGETNRFLLSICFTIATMVWMFGLLGGGIIITTPWNEYEFSLHMNKYIMLIVFVAGLNTLYYILEWRTYREEKSVLLPNNRKADNRLHD